MTLENPTTDDVLTALDIRLNHHPDVSQQIADLNMAVETLIKMEWIEVLSPGFSGRKKEYKRRCKAINNLAGRLCDLYHSDGNTSHA